MDVESLIKEIETALTIKVRAGVPFKIAGALLFGSMARGSDVRDSDIDLLVMAEGINPKRQRRGKEIGLLKGLLPPLPMDILLLTREEVQSNFRNHNPLFLDIAEEGVMVIDDDNFLKNLMAETRSYIRQRGIQRFGDGWIYLVKKGGIFQLSRVSNKDFSEAMLKETQRDLEVGTKLIEAEYHDKAVYHFQQSVEKSVKAVLIAKGVFQKTHFVGNILRRMISEAEVPQGLETEILELASISESIEPEVSLSRYPGIIDDSLWLPFEEYRKEDSSEGEEKARRALQLSKKFFENWFGVDS